MGLIWAFVLGWAHVISGTLSPIEIAMTLVVGASSILGLVTGLRIRSRTSAARATVVCFLTSIVYFVLVFAAGFVLGTVRTLWAAPRLGVRAAELMEAPIMLGVSILAARWAVRHVGIPPLRSRRLAMGCIALGLMLLVECSVVLWIRG